MLLSHVRDPGSIPTPTVLKEISTVFSFTLLCPSVLKQKKDYGVTLGENFKYKIRMLDLDLMHEIQIVF